VNDPIGKTVKLMQRRALEIACMGALLLSGLVHGIWTQRWQPQSQRFTEAVARLDQVPLVIGSWRGSVQELDAVDLTKAGVAGAFLRSYERSDGQARVDMLLVCGHPGPVSAHPPEACFRGTGYRLTRDPVRYIAPAQPPAQSAELWKAGFSRGSTFVPIHRSVYWAWGTTGAWRAPDNPRLAFASSPFLYKLYVTCETIPADENQEESACREFLSDLLPELQKSLFENPRQEGPGSGQSILVDPFETAHSSGK
jgi:hypothetical protein